MQTFQVLARRTHPDQASMPNLIFYLEGWT